MNFSKPSDTVIASSRESAGIETNLEHGVIDFDPTKIDLNVNQYVNDADVCNLVAITNTPSP